MISIQNLHHVPFLHETEQLRRTGTLCDTVLRVDGLSFKAHALILALASNRLKRQLTDQPNEGGGFSCAIESVSSHTFKQILDYVYGKIVQVSKKDMQELLRGAEYLEMETLVEQCQSLLREPGKDDGHQIENAERKKIQKDTQCSTTSRDGFSVEGYLTSINPGPSQSLSSPVTQKKISSPYSPIFISSSSFSTSPHFYCPVVCPSQSMLLNYRQLTAPHSYQRYPHPTPMYTIIQSPVSSSLMGLSSLYHPSYPFTPSPSIQNSPYIEGKNLSIHAAFTGSIPENHKRKPETLDKKERCCRRCAQWPMGNPCRSANGSSNSGSVDMVVSGRFYGQGRGRRTLRSIRRGLCGDKPYQCEQCSKRFSLKHQLDTHHRVHTGEKPFECRICGQRSRDYSAMIKHLRTHSGATPYQCTVCREFCSSLNAMQKHLKTHPSQDFPPDWSLRNTYLYISHTERC